MELKDRVALVTGGARRIGRAIALELGRGGCHVAVHCHKSVDEAKSTAAEIRDMSRHSAVVQGDLSDPAQWSRLIEESVRCLGRLDVIVNNASIFLTPQPDTLGAFSPELWERMLRVNLLAPASLAHHARGQLAGDGVIVNLCDAGVERPWPDHMAYCVSKAALENLTRSLARAMAPDVRVVGVAPGIAAFPDEFDRDLRDRLIRRVPMRRAGTPEEIARVVRFVVESGTYLNGEIIRVDGGRGSVG